MSKLTIPFAVLLFLGVVAAKSTPAKRERGGKLSSPSVNLASLPASEQVAAARSHLKRGHLGLREIEGEIRGAEARREVIKANCLRGYAALVKKSLRRAEGLVFDLTYVRSSEKPGAKEQGRQAASRPVEETKVREARASIETRLPTANRDTVVKLLTDELDKIQRLAWEARACTGEVTVEADVPPDPAPDKQQPTQRPPLPYKPPLASPARP